MKRTIFYLALLMGLACWATAPAVAKDDKKQTREEKREQKKKEKEAKKKKKKDGDEEAGEDEKNKKVDKKAVSKALKSLETAYGKAKGNGKYFMYVRHSVLTEAGEEMFNKLIEQEKALKAAKVNVLLVYCDPDEEETAVKLLKKAKVKYPMVMKAEKLAEELPGYSEGTTPGIIIVEPSGKVKSSGGPELADTWYDVVGAKKPAAREEKGAKDEETEKETEE